MPFPLWVIIFYRFDVPCMFLVCVIKWYHCFDVYIRLWLWLWLSVHMHWTWNVYRICIACLNEWIQIGDGERESEKEWKRESKNQIFHLITTSFVQEINQIHNIHLWCIAHATHNVTDRFSFSSAVNVGAAER